MLDFANFLFDLEFVICVSLRILVLDRGIAFVTLFKRVNFTVVPTKNIGGTYQVKVVAFRACETITNLLLASVAVNLARTNQ